VSDNVRETGDLREAGDLGFVRVRTRKCCCRTINVIISKNCHSPFIYVGVYAESPSREIKRDRSHAARKMQSGPLCNNKGGLSASREIRALSESRLFSPGLIRTLAVDFFHPAPRLTQLYMTIL
jgi:hypothetical protein